MAENTKIEWADHTFNPWVGCTKVSPACDHCYAEGWAKRSGMVEWGTHAERRRTSAINWAKPIKWNTEAERLGVRCRVFCASLADWADKAVPDQWRLDLAAVIRKTGWTDWLLLTKRIGNAAAMLAKMFPEGVPSNVWIGATVCNQEEADRDIPKLLALPVETRFLSMEPLLGPVAVFSEITGELLHTSGDEFSPGSIDWIIVGGESGPGARPMHPQWVRSLRDQCAVANGAAFFFKQWGQWGPQRSGSETIDSGIDHQFSDGTRMERVGKNAAGRHLDGLLWNESPSLGEIIQEPYRGIK